MQRTIFRDLGTAQVLCQCEGSVRRNIGCVYCSREKTHHASARLDYQHKNLTTGHVKWLRRRCASLLSRSYYKIPFEIASVDGC